MSIEIKSNYLLINLNKNFYDIVCIKTILDSFKKICKSDIKYKSERMLIKLTPYKKIHLKTLGYEFCNHVLVLMKNKSIV